MSKIAAVLIGSLFFPALWAQQATGTTTASPTAVANRAITARRVDPGFMYQRVYARVPMIGTGTKADPRRPMFAPLPGVAPTAVVHSGILSFQMQLSDDGNWALCEFVGATLNDLSTIINSTDPNVKVFVRGQAAVADILADFQNYKKNFTFQWFTGRPQ